MAGTAAAVGVVRPRSALHNCVSSSTSSRAGASVSFADQEVTADPKPQPADAGGVGSTVDWVVGRTPRGLGAQAALAGAVVVVGYQLAVGDLGATVHRACAVAVTVFSVSCSFCAVALRLRRSWTNTAVCSLFATCCGVELALGHALTSPVEQTVAAAVPHRPLLTVGVLTTAGVACALSPLDAAGGLLVVGMVGVARYLAGTMLVDLPCTLKPLLIYGGGLAGVVAARYIETTLVQSVDSGSVTGASSKSGVVGSPAAGASRNAETRRRRASTSATNSYSTHAAGRRVSLPTLVHKSLGTTVVLDRALTREAEGLLADMMVDPDVPRHLLSGLRAVSDLLKSTDAPLVDAAGGGGGFYRVRSSPVASLSDCSLTGEYTDLPYAERPVYLPKRLRRSVPSSLSRCRSACGTWTTTTSATGMPSLDTEPPASSRRPHLAMGPDGQRGAAASSERVSRQRLLTSDYESSDSPSSSEHGEHVVQRLSTSSSLSADRRRDAVPDTTDNADGDASPSPTSPFSFHVEQARDQDELQGDDVTPDVVTLSSSSPRKKTSGVSAQRISFSEHVSVISGHEEPGPATTQHDDLSYIDDDRNRCGDLLLMTSMKRWDFPVFELSDRCPDTLLSRVAYELFTELGFFSAFQIPVRQFVAYFHVLELGYRHNPYHNRLHATDVLHAVWYMTSQPVPGFPQIALDDAATASTTRSTLSNQLMPTCSGQYGVIGINFQPLELMALYTAAAMHDYDHPGRTNAFLVTTASPLAILYNDRSVLENHHAASAWRLMQSDPRFSWLVNLNYADFKRFRFIVIEAILATDLKRHFDLLSEFNAKANAADAVGIDWTAEADRLMIINMIIKMADINGPCKPKDLHMRWTDRITAEFYEQGDEESCLDLPISPYMNRRQPQLAKLQESFITHLVAPLCNALTSAGLLPGLLVDDADDSDVSSSGLDDDDSKNVDSSAVRSTSKCVVSCAMVKNLESNHDMWVRIIEDETEQNNDTDTTDANVPSSSLQVTVREVSSDSQHQMETISEEETQVTCRRCRPELSVVRDDI